MANDLIKLGEVDIIFRYPTGRTKRLVKQGKIAHIVLPDGEIRIRRADIEALLIPKIIQGGIMLVAVHVHDHVFEVVERGSREYVDIAGSDEGAEALFLKMVLSTHFLQRFREVLSPALWDRLYRLRCDDHGVMEFYLAYDDAERGTTGYSFERDADGLIDGINTPGGKLNPVSVEWNSGLDHLAAEEARLSEERKESTESGSEDGANRA